MVSYEGELLWIFPQILDKFGGVVLSEDPSLALRISPAGSRYAHARTTAQLSSCPQILDKFGEVVGERPLAEEEAGRRYSGAESPEILEALRHD